MQIGQRVTTTEDVDGKQVTESGILRAYLGDGWWQVRTDRGYDEDWHQDIIETSNA